MGILRPFLPHERSAAGGLPEPDDRRESKVRSALHGGAMRFSREIMETYPRGHSTPLLREQCNTDNEGGKQDEIL